MGSALPVKEHKTIEEEVCYIAFLSRLPFASSVV